jgi:hypothetical protein
MGEILPTCAPSCVTHIVAASARATRRVRILDAILESHALILLHPQNRVIEILIKLRGAAHRFKVLGKSDVLTLAVNPTPVHTSRDDQ